MRKQIELGPILNKHLDQLREWRNSPSVYSWCRQFEPISEIQHSNWWASLENNDSVKMYGVFNSEVDGSPLVGVCGLTSIDWINRRAEFSLYIAPNWQGVGLGQLALKALVKHAFSVLNLNCVWGEAFSGNPAIKMFKRVGFKEEGTRRSFYYRNGKYIDAVLFSILRGELA